MASTCFKIKICEQQTNVKVMSSKLCGKEINAKFEELKDKFDPDELKIDSFENCCSFSIS